MSLLALIAAGCGSSGSKTSSTETTAQKTTSNKKSAANQGKQAKKQQQDPNACGKLQILPESTKEGTCVQGQGAQKRDADACTAIKETGENHGMHHPQQRLGRRRRNAEQGG